MGIGRAFALEFASLFDRLSEMYCIIAIVNNLNALVIGEAVKRCLFYSSLAYSNSDALSGELNFLTVRRFYAFIAAFFSLIKSAPCACNLLKDVLLLLCKSKHHSHIISCDGV